MPNNTDQEKYKNFYTVKEAAKLLGFSTNTIYTYLNNGDLTGRRLNSRGRFKIPFEQLEPFLNAKEDRANEDQPVPQFETTTIKPANKLTGLEVLLGAAAGLLLVYSFWNVDMSSFSSASTSTQVPSFLKMTTEAIFNYSDRSFSKFGDIAEVVAFNVDKNVFKGSLIAQNISKSDKVLGIQTAVSDLSISAGGSVNDLRSVATKNIALTISLSALLLTLIFALVLLVKRNSRKVIKDDVVKIKNSNVSIIDDLANNSVTTKTQSPNYLKAAIVSVVFLISVLSSVFLVLGSIKLFVLLDKKTLVDQINSTDVATSEVVQNLDSVDYNDEYFDPVLIKTPNIKPIVVLEKPSFDSKIVFEDLTDQEVYKIDEKGEWIKIETKDARVNGWINTNEGPKVGGFSLGPVIAEVSAKEGENQSPNDGTVTIGQTPTGWLRVRNTPSGSEVAKVNPGEKYNVLDKKGKWMLIEYEENKTGWISSQYTTTN